MQTYKIVRHFFNRPRNHRSRALRTGLTLKEAQAHCSDPETSSTTCTNATGRRRTREHGPWFDAYTGEG